MAAADSISWFRGILLSILPRFATRCGSSPQVILIEQLEASLPVKSVRHSSDQGLVDSLGFHPSAERLELRVVDSQGAVRRVAPETASVTLRPDSYLAVRLGLEDVEDPRRVRSLSPPVPILVTADAPMLEDASTTVEFLFPIAFLAAASLGGLAGGAAVATYKHLSYRRQLLGGSLIGPVTAAAYTVGLNPLGQSFNATYGAALVFVIAALAAIGGLEVLTRLLTGGRR